MSSVLSLPAGVRVFERGWLSANNVLLQGRHGAALVDTGYATHSEQTLSLIRNALGGSSLDLLLNTHLHSDHCGGNAALQAAFPSMQTRIPPGQSHLVLDWDPEGLSYVPTGQQCPRFTFDGVLLPQTEVGLGEATWQVHAAPGHDPHSVVLFEPLSRTLISADSLWRNGFGVVFPELEGAAAFDDVSATLDLIEHLQPDIVIPGHGPVFGGREPVAQALASARSRLSSFVQDPRRHAAHGIKVLLKFHLLEVQSTSRGDLMHWARGTPYFRIILERYFGDRDLSEWVDDLVSDLVRLGVATQVGDVVRDA